MKFCESWLRTFVDPPLSSEALSHLLTMAGLEVEERLPVAPAFDGVVVAQVLSKEKHPNADRLSVLTVDVGQAEPLSIVCGAGNVTVGMKAPCALVGATLPPGSDGGPVEIKSARVRGVVSSGMMCSEKELGLAETGEGLMVLPDDARVGQNIREYLHLDDTCFTLKLTPNRSDCLSVRGIAREVAALTGATLQALPQTTFRPSVSTSRAVKVRAAEACPRYAGRVISGVNARARTPDWMVRRLERCGLRSINAVVDVTNYVLLELGQPLHAFDLDKLTGDIEVRFAENGEQIRLLNGETVVLQQDMLVIADSRGPVALAGIMGGAESAVGETTTDVFLESAFFAPSAIVGKTRRLGFSTDAAYRFERGVDFAATREALDRATQLILDICGGQAGAVTEVQGTLPERPPVRLRTSRVARVLGVELAGDVIADILGRLGMTFHRVGEAFIVTPPSHRFDLAIEEDLIEEVARVYGYENIHPLPIMARAGMLPAAETGRPLANVRQVMVLRDYQEAITYSFVAESWERDLCGNDQPIRLQNPIASQMSVMRSSLLGGLLSAVAANLARKQPRVRLFEIGGCFRAETGTYIQEQRLCGVACGNAYPEQWGIPARAVDFYDVKGDVEALLASHPLTFQAMAHPASHPGRSACILLSGRAIGWIGELHPRWQQKYELTQPVMWFEVELAALTRQAVPRIANVSRFPPVRRDLAVVVDESVTVQSLLEAMQGAQADYVVDIAVFDVYRGNGIAQGKKSLAFRVLLQDTQKTLTDGEIEKSLSRLVAALARQGARLRVGGEI